MDTKMQFETDVLRDAILHVWTPSAGARSIAELIDRNKKRILASQAVDPFPFLMIIFNFPIGSIMLYKVDKYFDKRPPFEVSEVKLSGSWSEGLFISGFKNMKFPDLDQMCVLKNISFSEDDQRAGNLTLREDTPFVYAYVTDEDAVKMWRGFLVEERNLPGKRLSSKKLKEKLHGNYQKFWRNTKDDHSNDVGTGPAMNINQSDVIFSFMKGMINDSNIHEYISNICFFFLNVCSNDPRLKNKIAKSLAGCDIVLSISCDGWPSCAKEWSTRDRIWPDVELVQKIINDGFHIVPKSSTEGDFRLSFSNAETTLIENFTKLQHKVLCSFKAVVKYHQSTWSPNIKKIITTYHLKTVAFWHFEKLAQESFTEESLVSHLVSLLQELAQALRKRELPMYFMPKVNLFINVQNPEETFDIAEKIEQLCQNFPQIIEAVENLIIGCSGRLFSLKKNEQDYREYLNGSREEASPSYKQMQALPTILNMFSNNVWLKLLDMYTMIDIDFMPQKTETEKDVLTSDLENSIELD